MGQQVNKKALTSPDFSCFSYSAQHIAVLLSEKSNVEDAGGYSIQCTKVVDI